MELPLDYTGLWFIGILLLCSFLWWIRKPIKYILLFITQCIGGVASIFLINAVFTAINIHLFVGVNWITAGIVGIFGFPGVALLYVVSVMYT